MRILVNYACENNGHRYSIGLEAVSDDQKDKVESVADELFTKAKVTILRQIEHQIKPGKITEKSEKQKTLFDETFAKKPKQKQPKQGKNSKPKGASWKYDPKSRKPEIKHPLEPATKRQKGFITRLARDRGRFIHGLNGFTKGEAGKMIKELLAV